MSLLLYVVGALAAAGGAAAILFGIPVKEFNFGDTLIVSGTVSLVGGLIVVGLAAAVSQLQRLAELVGTRPLSRSLPVDALEAARGSRAPFPAKPKPEPARAPVSELPPFVPAPIDEQVTAEEEERSAPSIRNPDLPLPGDEPAEEAPVLKPAASAPPPFRFPEPPKAPTPSPPKAEPPPRAAPSFELPPWRKPAPPPAEPPRTEPAQPSYFDAMWKNEPRTSPSAPAAETERSRGREPEPFRWPEPEPALSTEPVEPEPQLEAEEAPPSDEPPHAVAVLKSGVVDGMGYTLYVDGSIEAELPDGTLRFASINELRAHLEKTG